MHYKDLLSSEASQFINLGHRLNFVRKPWTGNTTLLDNLFLPQLGQEHSPATILNVVEAPPPLRLSYLPILAVHNLTMASRRPLPETLSMVAISFSSSTMSSRLVTSKVPKRGVATARRTHKALRPVPSPSAAAAMKYANSHANQIVFNPPPSAPSPYHTPPLFLPAEDPRRALLVLSHARSNPYASTTPKPLPPPISQPRAKTYHLTPEDIEEMRRLRSSDEWTWTKKKLAEKFGCSELFVAMCVQASETRKEWAKANLERVKERWGPRRRGAREERAKRRELWAKDM